MKTGPDKSNLSGVAALVLAALAAGCGGGGSSSTETSTPTTPTTPTTPEPTLDHSGLAPLSATEWSEGEYLSGGDATVFVENEDAFGTRPDAIANDFQLDANFTNGDHIFRTPHENAGPLLNTNNCQGCHFRDGRGVVQTDPSIAFDSMLVKIGDSQGEPDPIYGNQIQTFAVEDSSSGDFQSGTAVYEGSVNGDQLFGEAFTFVEYEEVTGSYPDGQSYSLRKPTYKVKDASFGAFMEDIFFSARVAPQVFGAGLLEFIPEENIRALADEDDADGDGISGRVSSAQSPITGETELGRFTYKAQTTSVLHQAAAAYLGDVGITTSIFAEENCTDAQLACQVAAELEQRVGEDTDFEDLQLAQVEFYNRVLGVPARRGYDTATDSWDADITAGREHFFNTGCVDCHTPRHVTEEASGSVLGELTLTSLEPDAAPIEVLSNQTIFPYTDLLLHDMGGSCAVSRETEEGMSCSEGQECLYVQRCEGLADGLVQGDASGTEWKTPALWGLGLVTTVNPEATFLHDGRARTIEEAILWHGGEAQTSLEAFKALELSQRSEMLAFLASL